jgi:Flp pilus assembly pilin Flp
VSFIIRLLRDRKGAALAEYGLLLAGITMVSLVAVSVLGGKVGGLVGSVASILPGAWSEQNAPVAVGQLVETRTADADGDGVLEQRLDMIGIADDKSGTPRLGAQLGLGEGSQGEHAASHLYQLGSKPNPFHGGDGN